MKIRYKKSDKRLFNFAIATRDEGNYDEAIKIMKKLVISTPHSPAYNGMLGGFYFETEKYYQALRYFKIASKLNPKSELASLGYFHSLWELNYLKAALNEMNRYLKIKNCIDYLEIIDELIIKKRRKGVKPYKEQIEKLYNKYLST